MIARERAQKKLLVIPVVGMGRWMSDDIDIDSGFV